MSADQLSNSSPLPLLIATDQPEGERKVTPFEEVESENIKPFVGVSMYRVKVFDPETDVVNLLFTKSTDSTKEEIVVPD